MLMGIAQDEFMLEDDVLARQSTVGQDMDEEAAVLETIASATSATYQPEKIDVSVITLLISRLAQLMAQEVDLLDQMNIAGLGELHAEKKALIDALEKQKRLMTRRNRLIDAISAEEYGELEELIAIFNSVMDENHKRLLVAREVNGRVVQAITEMANENAKQSYYTNTGQRADDPSVCISLNHSI